MIAMPIKRVMDGKLKAYCETLRSGVQHGWDGVCLIDGLEGSGKSSLAFQMAYELDPTFNLDNIVYTPDQFIRSVDKAQPEQAIVWDEFILAGMSTDALSNMQKTIIKKMTLIRRRRLYVILVVPSIFILSWYFAVHRTRFLLHCYTPDMVKRGTWWGYPFKVKNRMYNVCRKLREGYKQYRKDFGTFTNFFNIGVLDVDAYTAKKEQAEEDIATIGLGRYEQKRYKAFGMLIKYAHDELGYSFEKIAQLTGNMGSSATCEYYNKITRMLEERAT